VWQSLHTELAADGLAVVTVALDASVEEARPWVRRAGATHLSLIDREHAFADVFNVVNVPTVIWLDEAGRIVRPQDVHFVAADYAGVTKFHPRKPIAALRAWVRGEAPAYAGDPVADLRLPTATDQQARAAFTLGWWLHQHGRSEAAAQWFVRAGELAPHDFTIRRGSMPIRGIDPAGPAFFSMVAEWAAAGKSYYTPQADTATTADDFAIEPVPMMTRAELDARIAADRAEAAAADGG
jgi:hypothetical protein